MRVRLHLLSILLAIATGAQAQGTVVESPHGDLTDPCATCHLTGSWNQIRPTADLDHGRFGFPLEHAHATAVCDDCHEDLRFANAPTECSGCHVDVHDGELGTNCDQCHGTRTFIDLADQRRMHRQARFALTGSHAGADCEACHVRGPAGALTYLGVPPACADCHMEAYLNSPRLDHVSGGFSTECDFCHATTVWSAAIFNHERQLGPDAQCVNCHRDEYDRATNPNHIASAFPTTCQDCHSTRSWTPASFDHDPWFPINSGAHREEWDGCADCHPNSASYVQFDCLGCHPHSDRAKTDEKHSEVKGEYAYDSAFCYDCHPRGKE